LAQATAEFDARYARQHPVQNEQIRYVLAQGDLGFVAAQHCIDLVALCLKIIAKKNAQRLFVFYHSDFGCL